MCIRDSWEYRAEVFLHPGEQIVARSRIAHLKRPVVSINAASRQSVKTWPVEAWRVLLADLESKMSVIQLGDLNEPALPGILSFAGKLTKRQSMALLAEVDCHIGPDSFLMHAANGVDTPAVILFGASRLPSNLGYAGNENLMVDLPCASCWIHDNNGQVCPHDIRCMSLITPKAVAEAIERQLAKGRLPRHDSSDELNAAGGLYPAPDRGPTIDSYDLPGFI